MVCYMYYTDVFVGSGKDIEKLNKALKAVVPSSVKDELDKLTALADGLEKFIGYSGGGQGIGKNGTGGSQNYASSYDSNATWEKLCQNCQCKSVSNPSCSSCSCGSTSGSSGVCSDPSKCCADCNVRAAAKIFLGFLPCMWYALKFLKERCEGDWKDLYISNKDHSLHRFFAGMGFDLAKLDENKKGGEIFGPLSPLFNGSPKGPLESLYEKSKNYFTSRFTSRSHVISSHSLVSPSSKSKPETVRDILLWLSGLPFSNGFKALLEHCKRLCSDIKDPSKTVQFNDFESYLFDSCFLSPFVLGVIEDPGKEALKGFPPYKSEISKFSYPEDPSDLLEMLCEYARNVFPPLKFLCIQCKLVGSQGGWKDCAFGRGCADALESSSTSGFTSSGCDCPNSKTYLCTASGSNKDVHKEHCDPKGGGGKCINSGSCSNSTQHNVPKGQSSGQACTPCPHPLMRFLCDSDSDPSSPSPSSDSKSLFQPPKDFPKMGFSKENLPSPGRHGEALYLLLEAFHTVSFLTTLLKFELHVSRTPPETLGELFGFFLQFKDSSVFSSQLNTAFLDWISTEPGRPDGQNFTNALKTALEKFVDSHSPHSNDLHSLNGCHVPQGSGATCGPYLNPLAGDVYKNFIEDSPGMYLSWICYLPKDFKDRLEEFQGEFLDCCSSGSSSCKFVTCPCILPKLYKYGFSFMSASRLNGKKCFDFIQQLGKVISGEPFKDLLDAIEKFLWHIRFPFFLFILAFWAFVISYFLYVQLYKLDILELNSHDHLSRSFKIPPSILFSDASSKLKDLSYFSL
ncbi:variant erythrocyte surface antigen-1 family protein [Babesia divergens]|uniref:Variant erythrocyte surface antigen-1 family protein n=1 Tax=Babesia divergens TaxID=32595 RepID=A0AAD9G8H2_BABDI|nr:variant erythrocyte surface antigen-1 family protein [Babesia divergens]